MTGYTRYDKGGENAVYRDAWNIANPGAANPVAVAATLRDASAWIMHQVSSTDAVKAHPALRVMAGQLSYLYGVGSLGAEMENYDKVKSIVDKLNEAEDLTEKS